MPYGLPSCPGLDHDEFGQGESNNFIPITPCKQNGHLTKHRYQAGTVVAVVGSEGPFCHVVLGVGNGIVNAHNDAEYHVAITNYHTNLMLDPPLDADYL